MKTLFITALLAITITSCNHKVKETDGIETKSTSNELYACSMHPEITGKKGEECSKCGMELTELVPQKEATYSHNDGLHEHKDTTTVEAQNVQEKTEVSQESTKQFSTSEIIANYLKLKNALTKDDSKAAAIAGKSLLKTFNSTDTSSLNSKLKNELLSILEKGSVHAKHIGDNSGKIHNQREHFIMLSNSINDLIITFGSKQKLYQDFCPMANDGKGAIWISEVKEIKNPYYGAEMLSCGSLKKTF